MTINSRKVEIGNSAKAKLVRGVNTLADAVKTTLGPKGQNVIIQRQYGPPQVTKDGVTVAREIFLADPLEDTGARLVKQAAGQTADDIGDGTTSATVLAQAMIHEGLKFEAAGISGVSIKRGIDRALEIAIEELETISRPCSDSDTISSVATISANNDTRMGDIIATALQSVGKNGGVSVETGTQLKDELEIVNGYSYEHGYYSPYFINTDKNKVVLENPYLLMLDRPILNVNDIVPILEKLAQTGRTFLIMAEQINNDALATLVVNNSQGNVSCCAVRSPDWKGEKRKYLIEDLAVLTGGTVFSDENGKRPENAELEDLGQCNRVEVTKDSTLIVGGHGDKDIIQQRIDLVESEFAAINRGSNIFSKHQLEERLSNLNGGVALIKVGGSTSIEISEKKDRYDDSLHATKAAMRDGVVAGGGVGYLRLIDKLNQNITGDLEQDAGLKVVIRSLEEPLRRIALNADDKPDVVIEKVLDLNTEFGYNAQDSTYGNMFDTGIIDPTAVVKSALLNAGSVAGMLLTTGCAIHEIVDTDDLEAAKRPAPPAGHVLPDNWNNDRNNER